MAILVTGGAGFIGSHTVVELLEDGQEVVVIDNLSNSNAVVVDQMKKITGKEARLYEGDIRDASCLQKIFSENAIESVVHFAGLKAVGESTEIPLTYYQNNVAGTVTLCEEIGRAGIFKMVFSSSCTVYGDPKEVPISEACATGVPTNPYGRSKLMIEEILKDVAKSDERWRFVLLRYFNPVGAHPSGLIGEDPKGLPNNLVPYVAQVAVGRLEFLRIFGDDYPTKDGTGVRDYIHVVDLALGHLKALERIKDEAGVFIYNLGTGTGSSVLEVVKAFEKACGKEIPYQMLPRRAGDIAENFAAPALAEKELGWKTTRNLDDMMADSWKWQSMNPEGFK